MFSQTKPYAHCKHYVIIESGLKSVNEEKNLPVEPIHTVHINVSWILDNDEINHIFLVQIL